MPNAIQKTKRKNLCLWRMRFFHWRRSVSTQPYPNFTEISRSQPKTTSVVYIVPLSAHENAQVEPHGQFYSFMSLPSQKVGLAWTCKLYHKPSPTHFHGHFKARVVYYLHQSLYSKILTPHQPKSLKLHQGISFHLPIEPKLNSDLTQSRPRHSPRPLTMK